MPTYSLSGAFGWAGGGKAGALVDIWATSRFAGPPAENDGPPSGSPDAGPVTTGPDFGSPGAFIISGITILQDYYVRVQYGGQTFWGSRSANDLTGAPVASGVTNVTGDETSIHVVNGTTVPIISLMTGTGDVTWSAGSTHTELQSTSNVDAVVGGLASVTAKAPLASPTFTGVPAVPTAAAGTSTTQVASTAFVTASPQLAGVPTAPTAAPGTNTTQLATTAFVAAADIPGTVLGSTQYNPASQAAYTLGGAFVVLDATNLSVTFTAPPSSNVVFSFEAFAAVAAGAFYQIGIDEAGTQVGSAVLVAQPATALACRFHIEIEVTGIGAGSHTYRVRGGSFNGFATSVFAGGPGTGGVTANNGGPAMLKVTAA